MYVVVTPLTTANDKLLSDCHLDIATDFFLVRGVWVWLNEILKKSRKGVSCPLGISQMDR